MLLIVKGLHSLHDYLRLLITKKIQIYNRYYRYLQCFFCNLILSFKKSTFTLFDYILHQIVCLEVSLEHKKVFDYLIWTSSVKWVIEMINQRIEEFLQTSINSYMQNRPDEIKGVLRSTPFPLALPEYSLAGTDTNPTVFASSF